MRKRESLLDNETHKLPGDFNIQTGHLISAKRREVEIINKKGTYRFGGRCCPGRPQTIIESKQKLDKYLYLAREFKFWNTIVTGITIVIGSLVTVTKGLVKELEDFETRGRVKAHKIIVLLR